MSGVFTTPEDGKYMVTLTATLAKNPETDIMNFAQLFIMKNGKLTALDHYLVVEQQKVANLKTKSKLIFDIPLALLFLNVFVCDTSLFHRGLS